MWLKLPLAYMDPATQAPLPDAILVIADAAFALRGGSVVLQCAVYASAAAYLANRAPMSETPIALSPGEIAQQSPALLGACYTILGARPDFAGANLVIP